MASELRNIELSVDYRIWVILRQQGWFVDLHGIPLTASQDAEDPANTFATADRMPWVFLDEFGDVDATTVKVYAGGVLLNANTYAVDYLRGSITFTGAPPAGAITADVLVSAAHVVEGYPDDEWLKNNALPVVAWQNTNAAGEAFGIGTVLEDRTFFFTIDIIANNKGERSDLRSDLHHQIIRVEYYDMSGHQPLRGDGSIDVGFDPHSQFLETMKMTRKPRSETINPRVGGLDKERHRALVTFQVERVS
jgi:hypothetical protein